jgi:hypothetical protein
MFVKKKNFNENLFLFKLMNFFFFLKMKKNIFSTIFLNFKKIISDGKK